MAVHGSAPDIAGRDIANPAAALNSAAMLLEYGLGRREDAVRLTHAVARVSETHPTADLGGTTGTAAFGDAVLDALGAAEMAGA